MNRKDINFNHQSEAFRAFRDDYYNEVRDMLVRPDVTPWDVERYSRIIEGHSELVFWDDLECVDMGFYGIGGFVKARK